MLFLTGTNVYNSLERNTKETAYLSDILLCILYLLNMTYIFKWHFFNHHTNYIYEHASINYLLGLHILVLKNVPYRCTKLSPHLRHKLLHFYSSSDLFGIQLKNKISEKTVQNRKIQRILFNFNSNCLTAWKGQPWYGHVYVFVLRPTGISLMRQNFSSTLLGLALAKVILCSWGSEEFIGICPIKFNLRLRHLCTGCETFVPMTNCYVSYCFFK